ncbi:alpha-amylase family glycosyl hydrolase [uncultured Pseudacidovorax sp.]|uniref:alpha-amylase family glycosyl hydrolase n=1 Tax=uncultured Pseudacidovorax sp. TaxID=679313 RepID=UPI0025DA6D53|nr:alpha-amylase family glycosyl hydrolase [uncultured Pseudacidovorax sp.]
MHGNDDTNWWRGAVIYQIYPRSFMDSNGDGIGDLPGITARLDHVAQLGADAVWISPFFRSPMKDFGYDVADYRDVDPIFGTLADFDALLARAHALGLKVIIDQVLSHTSDQHAWFAQSRSSRDNARADWYVWADPRPDGTPPNNWLSVFGGSAWQWDARRRQYYLHSFLAEQPDLNFHCPAVQDALLAEVRFWCERGVDGFRFDACNHQFHDAQLRDNPPAAQADIDGVSTVRAENPYAMQRHLHDKSQPENLAFLERVRALLDAHGAVALGEVGDENAPPIMARYTEAGRRLHMAYSFSLLTSEHSARHLRAQVQALEDALTLTGGWGCWAVSNHDVPRVATRWSAGRGPDAARDRLWLALLVSLRGSASLYQGEELGLPEADVPFERLQDPYGRAFWPEFKGRDGCRTPMPWHTDGVHGGFSTGAPWLPVDAAHLPLAVDRQSADARSMLAYSRALLHWRRSQPLLRTGAQRFVDAPEPVLHLVRSAGTVPAADPDLHALFNLSPEPQTLALPAPLRAVGGHPCTGGRLDDTGYSLHLEPYGVFYGTPLS